MSVTGISRFMPVFRSINPAFGNVNLFLRLISCFVSLLTLIGLCFYSRRLNLRLLIRVLYPRLDLAFGLAEVIGQQFSSFVFA